jgi:hypothetical protein
MVEHHQITGDDRVVPGFRAFAQLRARLVPYLAAEASPCTIEITGVGLDPASGTTLDPIPEPRSEPQEAVLQLDLGVVHSVDLLRRRGDLSLDESFFPVVWDENGGRSAWLAELPSLN